jgi:hypothetical protein
MLLVYEALMLLSATLPAPNKKNRHLGLIQILNMKQICRRGGTGQRESGRTGETGRG